MSRIVLPLALCGVGRHLPQKKKIWKS